MSENLNRFGTAHADDLLDNALDFANNFEKPADPNAKGLKKARGGALDDEEKMRVAAIYLQNNAPQLPARDHVRAAFGLLEFDADDPAAAGYFKDSAPASYLSSWRKKYSLPVPIGEDGKPIIRPGRRPNAETAGEEGEEGTGEGRGRKALPAEEKARRVVARELGDEIARRVIDGEDFANIVAALSLVKEKKPKVEDSAEGDGDNSAEGAEDTETVETAPVSAPVTSEKGGKGSKKQPEPVQAKIPPRATLPARK